MIRIILIIAILVSASIINLLAQEADYTYFNSSNGFVDDIVSALYVDSQNRVWIGTQNNGIFTYQDSLFTHYDDNEYDLLTGRASVFEEDEEGNIWIGFYDPSQGGVMMFDGENFITKHTPSDSIAIGRVVDIAIDEANDELLVYEAPNLNNLQTLNVIHGEDIATYFFGANDIFFEPQGSVVKTDDGQIWLTGEFDGIYTLEGEEVINQNSPLYEFNNEVYTGAFHLLKDNDGMIWVGQHRGGLGITNQDYSFWDVMYMEDNEYDNHEGIVPGHVIQDMSRNEADEVWLLTTDEYHNVFGSIGNMYACTIHEGYFIPFVVLEDGLLENYFGKIIADYEANVWVGLEGEILRLSNISFELAEDTTMIEDTTTMSEFIHRDLLEIYPNPTTNFLMLSEAADYQIMSIDGIIRQVGNAHVGRINFDLPSGLYYIKLETDNYCLTKAFMVQP